MDFCSAGTFDWSCIVDVDPTTLTVPLELSVVSCLSTVAVAFYARSFFLI